MTRTVDLSRIRDYGKSLGQEFGWPIIPSKFEIDAPKHLIPWANKPKHAIRYYQEEAINALFANCGTGPVSIELPTGSGKSRVIEEILHRNPVQSIVVTPSANITTQLFAGLTHLLGTKYVGKYGDGKKDLGKLFTVCTGQALSSRRAGDSDAWD